MSFYLFLLYHEYIFIVWALLTSSPDCGGLLVLAGLPECSGSVRVSGCESDRAPLLESSERWSEPSSWGRGEGGRGGRSWSEAYINTLLHRHYIKV